MVTAFPFHEPPASTKTPVGLRAPELILGLSINEKIDIWSLGCLIFEMLTGSSLFLLVEFGYTNSELTDDHMIQLVNILGPLPPAIQARWERYSRYYDSEGTQIRFDVGSSDDVSAQDDVDEQSEANDG